MEDNVVVALRCWNLMQAVENGNLERVRAMVDEYGLPYFKFWFNGYCLLRAAAERNHMSVAELLLTKGADVNSSNYILSSSTPLKCAVQNGNITLTQMMIDRGADVNCKSFNISSSVIYIAVENNNVEITEILLKHGADVNAIDEYDISFLQVAVKNKSVILVEKLLKYGASTTCKDNNYAPLLEAVGSTEIMKLLLYSGANVNVEGEDDITPLHVAACKGRNDIVTLLLNHGACILSSTSEGLMPLHFACAKCNEEAAVLLINKGADINAKDKSTPLHLAVRAGHTAIVKLLLENGANINNEDTEGRTVLNIAVNNMNELIVNYILKYSPDINNESNRKSIKTAISAKYMRDEDKDGEDMENESIVELLLDYGFSIHPDDINDPELLHAAVKRGYFEIVECLLEYAPNSNMATIFSDGSTLLHSAVAYGHEEIASLLIKHGADVNSLDQDNKLPMFYSIQNVDYSLSQLLLFNGAKVKDNRELLELAVRSSVEIVRAILQQDVDVNAVDRDGRTLLHIAVEKVYCYFKYRKKLDYTGEIVQLLLDKGANVDALDNKNQTPLHIAIKNRHLLVKILLDNNANININCGVANDITPLHLAVKTVDVRLITLILSKGVDINAEMNNGYTALHIAVRTNRLHIVNLLLKHGANVEQKTRDGSKPLHFAAEQYNYGIIESLLKFGACINSRSIKDLKVVNLIAHRKTRFENVVGSMLQYDLDINKTCSNNILPLENTMERFLSGSYQASLKLLNLHIIKLIRASLFVEEGSPKSKELLYFESYKIKQDKYQLMCDKEVANMKIEMISGNISFYNILKKDASYLAISCMRNEQIVQVLKANEYRYTFPIYATMIESNFRRALVKKDLLEKAYNIILLLCKHLPVLPYYCTEKILSYLNNVDLQVLLNVFKSSK